MLQLPYHPSIVQQSDLDNEVLAELGALLRSEYFCRSRQSSAFLQFVVEQTLHGNRHVLTERTIAIFVFGKINDYDPSLNAYVRVRANDVRRRLASYYGSKEVRPHLAIVLSPGTYVPNFVRSRGKAGLTVRGRSVLASLLTGKGSVRISLQPLSIELLSAASPILELAYGAGLRVVFEQEIQPLAAESLGILLELDSSISTPQLVADHESLSWWRIAAATPKTIARLVEEDLGLTEESNF